MLNKHSVHMQWYLICWPGQFGDNLKVCGINMSTWPILSIHCPLLLQTLTKLVPYLPEYLR